MSLQTLADKVVVITGAGSGIGRALALRAARGGALLALSDWNAESLAETVRLAEQAGAPKVRHDVVDVSDREAVRAWAEGVVEEYGRVELVVNNAGVTATGDFTDLDYDDLDWIVGVNFYGVVHGSKEFLPHLVASGNGALVNVSSLFGLVSAPGQSAYNATKYAVRGLTEAIREEMLVAGHPVTVTCVHPGGIRTGISRNGRKAAGLDAARIDALFEKNLARTSPDRAAQIILDGALAGKPRVLVGLDAHVIHHLAKLAGARYQDVVARMTSRMPLR
ncbi:NAD(P)-dependent dehydrogenase (short-subunit alcohol dehydrogenase family) [Nocardioides cavernae]|uniref:NAD(P)-dependent dehydrogenase (Short-subunit alcohol dehydrogenase family) n=1 Tax=Nocardioides cavernae TaxID=1921566 RepID=A0A7Y9H086_9ACTN|nr:SDR family oxidoreductase [Nocardioides cavernae]NYE35585.1 NAD(P)-dependent dehydrogenase (short-subunit alcohol dehydrogenase family) [Nocardioides cavernae]